MKIFAISDLHLSFSTDKPMDIFGSAWENYWQKITQDWQSKVGEDDVVLIAGDISWAMTIEDAKIDLAQLAKLSGKKVLIKGNHDYWWSSYSKVKSILPPNIFAIQNNCLRFGSLLVAGTRGWSVPTDKSTADDIKIYEREFLRLSLTLDEMQKQRTPCDSVIVMLHYPPFDITFSSNKFTDLIVKTSVDAVIYGHLHGKDCRAEAVVDKCGIPFFLTSCDQIDNKLIRLLDDKF